MKLLQTIIHKGGSIDVWQRDDKTLKYDFQRRGQTVLELEDTMGYGVDEFLKVLTRMGAFREVKS